MIPLAWLFDFIRIVEQIDNYGEAIEYDFFERGWNILDWFNGRFPIFQLSRLVDRLPDGSHYSAATAQDEELARFIVANGLDIDASGSPSMIGYDRVVAKLDQLYDLLAGLLNQNGAKIDPAERPVRAIDNVRREQSFSRHLDRVAALVRRH